MPTLRALLLLALLKSRIDSGAKNTIIAKMAYLKNSKNFSRALVMALTLASVTTMYKAKRKIATTEIGTDYPRFCSFTPYFMNRHLQNFLESFIAKRYRERRLHRAAKTNLTKKGNPLRGMDALYRELDERYCIPLPKANQQQEIAFVRQALANYKLTTCYVLSAYEPFNEQNIPIEEALEKIVGGSSTTIISFLPGVAYFEGHSVGERYLCIKEVR